MRSAGPVDYKGMKKIALLALLPLTLGSCGLFGTPKTYAINGTITNTAPAGTVKLAVIGVNATGAFNENVGQIAVPVFNTGTKKFSVDYPSTTTDGLYQVIAFIDSNGDGKYQANETRTQNNNKYLVYSSNDVLSFKKGWNYLVGTTVTQPTVITDYDLSW